MVTGNRILSILRELPDETIRFTVGAHDVGVARNRIAAVVSTVLASGTICDADGAIIHVGDEITPFATIEGGPERRMGYPGLVTDIVDNVVYYEPYAAGVDGATFRYYASAVVVTKRSVPRDLGVPVAFAEPADHAKAVKLAKHLFDIGFSGPRHGGIPRMTGNLMCEAAETMLKLLGEQTFSERLGLEPDPAPAPGEYQIVVGGRTLLVSAASREDLASALCDAIDTLEALDDGAEAVTRRISEWRNGRVVRK